MSSSLKEAWEDIPPATTALTVAGLNTLANNTDAVSNAIDNYNSGNAQYLDGLFRLTVTTGASGVLAAGYLDIFVQPSLDNSIFSDKANDLYVDTINLIAISSPYVKHFSVAKALDGFLAPYFKLRFNNQCGAALVSGAVAFNLAYNTVG